MGSAVACARQRLYECFPRTPFLATFFVVAFVASGCTEGDRQIDLAFSEIVRVENNYDVTTRASSRSPSLIIASRAEDVSQFTNLVDVSDLDTLTSTDFSKEFLVLARLGNQSSARFSITVDRISRRGDTISIRAVVGRPNPNMATETLETSPYHLVRVSKIGEWNDNFDFLLEIEGATVASMTQYIP